MPYRNKVYVAFDADRDIHYYRLMKAWKQNDYTDFNFYDAHDLKQSRDSSMKSTIINSLRDRINISKMFVLLVGERTKYLRKFVSWEINQAINREIPIIVVNLNGMRSIDSIRCPDQLIHSLVLHVSFNTKILQLSLQNWGGDYLNFKRSGQAGPFYYDNNIYRGLGI